jgi:hypothetical protein
VARTRNYILTSLTASAVLLLGCTGKIIGDDAGGSGYVPPTQPADAPPAGFKAGPSGLRRLTVAQYQNSIKDLFGEQAAVSIALEADTVLNGFASIGASRMALSPLATEQFEAAALEVAKLVFADSARRSALAGCDPVADAACTDRFITSFGQRAWRRPLTQVEVARYSAIAGAASIALGNAWGGLEYATAGLLQSPHFLYRVEVGTQDPSDHSRYRLDDFEVATRLAYLAWNTTPDEALLTSAAGGKLGTPQGLLGEAQRLFGSPRAQVGLSSFFDEYLQLRPLLELPQLPEVFPQVSPTLGAAMRNETQRFMSAQALSGGDFRNIFDSRTTFVNAELAGLYGLSGVTSSEPVQVQLPADGMRAGLLGQAGFLALNAHADAASATLRGKFIREVLLCQAIPPPPPDVVTTLPENTATGPQTRRQRLQIHNEVPACAACHRAMDPIGLGLENFDGIGAYRTTEQGLPIDASGELDGVAFNNPVELGQALKQHPGATDCLVRSVYRYTVGRLETEGEAELMTSLESGLAQNGYDFAKLLVGVVSSAGFRYSGGPQ